MRRKQLGQRTLHRRCWTRWCGTRCRPEGGRGMRLSSRLPTCTFVRRWHWIRHGHSLDIKDPRGISRQNHGHIFSCTITKGRFFPFLLHVMRIAYIEALNLWFEFFHPFLKQDGNCIYQLFYFWQFMFYFKQKQRQRHVDKRMKTTFHCLNSFVSSHFTSTTSVNTLFSYHFHHTHKLFPILFHKISAFSVLHDDSIQKTFTRLLHKLSQKNNNNRKQTHVIVS